MYSTLAGRLKLTFVSLQITRYRLHRPVTQARYDCIGNHLSPAGFPCPEERFSPEDQGFQKARRSSEASRVEGVVERYGDIALQGDNADS